MKIVSLIILLITSNLAFGQAEASIHQQTTPPLGARFEFVQSSIVAQHTFRLDTYTGRIWRLVFNSNDENTWEEMPVMGLPRIESPERSRFMVFTSGIAARHTFLFDSDTGESWVVVVSNQTDPGGNRYERTIWRPFAD